ncbi:hypothetical protein SAMN05421578_104243 [Paenibacillus macquariensis]|uniref:Uncharacterized protein n=1 Tax=Paenibacillus macquariensis TaxID=948756 RepID=A0ABY1JV62_9BACL|nr:hypothetical protein SAMN05421578_104243 [Paenibacillus macquariensis]
MGISIKRKRKIITCDNPGLYDINQNVHEQIVTPQLVEDILLFCLSESNGDN